MNKLEFTISTSSTHYTSALVEECYDQILRLQAVMFFYLQHVVCNGAKALRNPIYQHQVFQYNSHVSLRSIQGRLETSGSFMLGFIVQCQYQSMRWTAKSHRQQLFAHSLHMPRECLLHQVEPAGKTVVNICPTPSGSQSPCRFQFFP